MEWKRFVPLFIAIPLLIGLVVYGQGRQASDPLKTQIPGGANSLDQLDRFQLAMELEDNTQVEMDYEKPEGEEMFALVRRETAEGDVDRVEGDPALKQIQALVQSIPSLTESETLKVIQRILDQEKVAAEKLRRFELRYQLKDGLQKMITLQHEKEQPEKPAPQNQQTSLRTPAPQQPAPQQQPKQQPQQPQQQTPQQQAPQPPRQPQTPQQQVPEEQAPEQPAPEEPAGEQAMPEDNQGPRNNNDANNNNNNNNGND